MSDSEAPQVVPGTLLDPPKEPAPARRMFPEHRFLEDVGRQAAGFATCSLPPPLRAPGSQGPGEDAGQRELLSKGGSQGQAARSACRITCSILRPPIPTHLHQALVLRLSRSASVDLTRSISDRRRATLRPRHQAPL